MNFQQTQKLKCLFKKHIKNNIVDIFLIGSAIKNKINPRDLDVIALFRKKELKLIEEELFNIKESVSFIKEIHIEPLFVDSMFKERIFLTLMHEGISIKENKPVSEIIGLKSFSIFCYNL